MDVSDDDQRTNRVLRELARGNKLLEEISKGIRGIRMFLIVWFVLLPLLVVVAMVWLGGSR